jgi:hypothetical protein
MKVWITKYALTKGIYTLEAEDSGDGMVKYGKPVDWSQYYHGNEWHRTNDAAVQHVATMISAKRKAIAKQMAKLDGLERSLGLD